MGSEVLGVSRKIGIDIRMSKHVPRVITPCPGQEQAPGNIGRTIIATIKNLLMYHPHVVSLYALMYLAMGKSHHALTVVVESFLVSVFHDEVGRSGATTRQFLPFGSHILAFLGFVPVCPHPTTVGVT